jgi:hypothetical protein
MKFLKNLFFVWMLLASFSSMAQIDFKFGFRAGATLSNISGPLEKDDSGNNLESYKMTTRICVGATVSMPINDRIGLGAEVLFSQKGALQRFESDNSFLKLTGTVADPNITQIFQGQKKIMSMNITNGYVEIPLTFYAYAIKDRLMFDFGPSVSFLVSSRSLGILKYGTIDPVNPNAADFLEMEIDYRAGTDDAGALATGAVDKSGRISGTTINYPSRLGAYYFFDEKKGSYFNTVDFGLNFGTSLFFTKGLRVGARGYYGLLDVTNNNYDISQKSIDSNRDYIFRKDKDVNWGIQFFVALQF